ncbi:MAG: FAA hydrolase family protein [Acidobacteria bacterium]|nr:MAG: FAA hydrolase family protein [Acidobacteriota bacterium]
MRFCSFRGGDGIPRFGFQLDDRYIVDIPAALACLAESRLVAAIPRPLLRASDLKTWLAVGPSALDFAEQLRQLLLSEQDSCRSAVLETSGLRLAPPIPNAGKIIAIGLNYRDHAAEQKAPLPKAPLIFAKFPTALIGHEDEIRLPDISQKVDVEAELCVVIGKTGRGFAESAARGAIAGYTVGNDVSARDLQFSDKQWVRGKSCDTFAPSGPFLVTPDEIADPHDLKIELKLNGRLQQSSNTREMVFNSYALVAYISQSITLETGDLIYTGTPAGVGVFRDPPVFVKPGDVVEVSIEKIGTLRNRVAQEP